MTAREIQVLEDTLNYWVDEMDSTIAIVGDVRYFNSTVGRCYLLFDLITKLGLKYKPESITKSLLTTEYTTTHYTLYAD